MQKQVLVTRKISPDLITRLREHFEVTVNEGPRYSRQQLQEALKDKAGVLVAGGDKFDGELVKGLSGLRAICVSAAGFNNIDVPAMTKAGIMVTNSPGPADETTADFAWGLLISTARRLVEAAYWVEAGNWKGAVGNRFFGTDVHGKVLGIIGMGRIGQAIARRAAGFRMRVIYHNRSKLSASIEKPLDATWMELDDLLRKADFVLLSLPYTPDNHHMIGSRALRLMQPAAMIFNIARGGLIDEEALADALRSRQIAAAGLDVFEDEPTIYEGLKGLPNVVLTPHIAGGTEATQYGLASMAADNLIAALGNGTQMGRPPALLNPEVLKG